MTKRIIPYVLAFCVLAFSLLSWFSIDRAINVRQASGFIMPSIFFSLYATSICIMAFLVKKNFFFEAAVLISMLVCIFFIGNINFLLFVVVAMLLMAYGKRQIVSDIENRVRVRIKDSLGSGIYEIFLSLAILITGQYFLSINKLDSKDLVPVFESGKTSSLIISSVLERTSPEFKGIGSESLTVDKFLENMYATLLERQREAIKKKIDESAEKNEMAISMGMIDAEGLFGQLPEGTKEEVLSLWKDELSKMAGYEITGEERVTEVIMALVNNKMGEAAESVNRENGSVNVIAAVFSVGLFLALISMSPIFSKIWIFLASVVFHILKKKGIVNIKKHMKVVERID